MDRGNEQKRPPLSIGKSLLYVMAFWTLTGLLFYGLYCLFESVNLYDVVRLVVKG